MQGRAPSRRHKFIPASDGLINHLRFLALYSIVAYI